MEITLCDNCEKKLMAGITLSCGYGSYLDGDIMRFCDDKCLLLFYRKKYSQWKRIKDRDDMKREASYLFKKLEN